VLFCGANDIGPEGVIMHIADQKTTVSPTTIFVVFLRVQEFVSPHIYITKFPQDGGRS
jgi:hypothetical protein